jgi:hypothetical protein
MMIAEPWAADPFLSVTAAGFTALGVHTIG